MEKSTFLSNVKVEFAVDQIFFMERMKNWLEHFTKCVALNNDYVEKQTLKINKFTSF